MVIGITGSIATGKSLVSNYLVEKGFQIIDSDKIVHQLLLNDEVIEEIVSIFGISILKENQLNKGKLAKIIFENKNSRIALNNIIHPYVIDEINKKTKGYKGIKSNLIFVDIPLLFEEKLEYLVDKIIVVYTPKDKQVKRLQLRDDIDFEYAVKKIEAAEDIESKKAKADYIIDNSNGKESTYKLIDETLRRIKNEI